MKPGPIWHETLLARRIQPVARELESSAFRTSRGAFSGTGSDTDGGGTCSAQGSAGRLGMRRCVRLSIFLSCVPT
jgi:hypothetical protein